MEQAQKLPDFADVFERVLVPAIFERYARDLVDRARPIGPSDRILDLGCGTGIVARVLRERLGGGAHLTGIDINAGMLAKARSIAPDITWVEGNAMALPVPDRAFELVLAQQVIQFTPDHAAAVREIRRVLAPGGRVLAATWRPRKHQPLFDALGTIAEKHLGPDKDKRMSLDGDALRALFEAAGFIDVKLEEVSLEERFAPGSFPIQGNLGGAGYSNIPPETMATIVAESNAAISAFSAADGTITQRSVTNVLSARVS